ncbi:MAG: hypothetical protein PHT40_01530 [Patescibacteria group bacterium]|nr:hypothetical protein [Patescibacteria group bacterium]
MFLQLILPGGNGNEKLKVLNDFEKYKKIQVIFARDAFSNRIPDIIVDSEKIERFPGDKNFFYIQKKERG